MTTSTLRGTTPPPSANHHRSTPALQARFGPWAVVTGGSSGIGLAIARRLASDGIHLVLVARDGAALETAAADMRRECGIEARSIALDLAKPESIGALLDGTAALDIGLFVAAAGYGTSGLFIDSSIDEELAMLYVNCRAVTALTHGYARRFAARGRGGIVLMSSIVAFQGTPYAAHYSATKAYVQTLADGLHVELAPRGVSVLASAPGPTNSGFAARAGMRMGAALTPDDVARGTLAALGNRSTVLPGMLSKVLTWSLSPLPRWARVRIMGTVMRGMTSHQRPA